jgi:hypothetical protein
MAFAISGSNGFISQLKGEGARSSLFEASMTLKGSDVEDGTSLFPFMCKGVALPGSTMGVVTINYFGRAIKYPGNRTFEDLTTTIINDEGYVIRNRVEKWLDQINSHSKNIRSDNFAGGKLSYTSDLTLQPFKKTGDKTDPWKFVNCFPTSVDAMDVAWDTNDAIMEYSVTWAYDFWTHDISFGSQAPPLVEGGGIS